MANLSNDERVMLKRMTYDNSLNGMIATLAKAILKLNDESV